jgi:Secretion system C-terminal sorting domain
MKKITLLLAMALATMGMNAQNTYTLTTLNGQTYTDITGGTSINNNQIWDLDYYGEFDMPINFKFEGQTVTRFLFDDDSFAFLTADADYDSEDFEGVYMVYPTTIFIQDRTYDTGTSSSPISYTVEGTAPNRIMKLQLKNVGSENNIWFGFEEDEFYMNFQIWLYESDNAIEIRHGESNMSTEYLEAYAEDGGFAAAAIFKNDTAYMAYGDPANATYGEFTETTFPEVFNGFPTFPANGTVYRFGPATTTGTDTFTANTFSVYPNPATTVINIQAAEATQDQYAIYNILGSRVAQGNLTGTTTAINVANLQQGVYVIKTGTQNLKFIKQ